MKVIWNPAITLDGYIALADGDSDWVDDADSAFFRKLIGESGAVIVGRTTYDQYKGIVFPTPNAITYVLTSHPDDAEIVDGVSFINATPQKLLDDLETQKLNQVVLAGGCKTSTEFMNSKLIDEIIANIYPLLFGQGIKMLEDKRVNLELLTSSSLANGIIQNHYKVIR